MTKKLIINADDYGLDNDANEAIISLARIGVVTSTSVMANFVSVESISLLKQTGISSGLHLNLIEGKPVSDLSQVSSLTDDKGNFLSWHQLLIGFILNRIKKNELENEIANQLEKLREKGLTISHADSHKHIHQYPVLGPFILQTFRRLGIQKVRNCAPSNWKHDRMFTLSLFSYITSRNLRMFQTPQRLVSYFSVNEAERYHTFIEELLRLFERYDVLEVMTHPGLCDRKNSYLKRQSEYEYLKNVFFEQKQRLKDVELIRYTDL
jgi:chitin disaccharide deacetylase